MKVALMSSTSNADELILTAARNDYYSGDVSIDEFETLMGNADTLDLMKKLMIRGHWGPLEHASFTIHFDCSRACMAQITRHRFISFDVQSMRYVNFKKPKFYGPVEHWDCVDGYASIKTRKGVKRVNAFAVDHIMFESYKSSLASYQKLVEMGVPEEDARNVLPIATKVNVVATMNLRTAFHIISMRGAGDAQAEVRELADSLKDIVQKVAPAAFQVWSENRRVIEKQRLSP